MIFDILIALIKEIIYLIFDNIFLLLKKRNFIKIISYSIF